MTTLVANLPRCSASRPWPGMLGRSVRPAIALRSVAEIDAMRRAGRIVRAALASAARSCVAGATTAQVDAAASAEIARRGGGAIFLGYPRELGDSGDAGTGGDGTGPARFPAATCVSVNEELIHGIPGKRVLADGDLVSIDCGAAVDGWCADAAVTVVVGRAPARLRSLVETTAALLDEAIAGIRPGRAWSGIAAGLQRMADAVGLSIVTEYVGHGIGRDLHEAPEVPCHAFDPLAGRDFTLRPGMTLAIEPMLTVGSGRTRRLADGWTIVTADGLPAAHFEHTIVVTSEGAEVLTGSAAGDTMGRESDD